MQHMLHENVALALVRNGRREGIFNYFVAQGLIGKDLVSSLDNCNVFPLYLYEEYHGKMQKVPNMNSEIVKKIETALGEKTTPEDIFNYIYAVLHSPTYREKWAEIVRDVKARGAWDEIGMDPKEMLFVEKATGFDDWTDPQLSAIYWARLGLVHAQGRDKAMLVEIVRQAAVIYRKKHAGNG